LGSDPGRVHPGSASLFALRGERRSDPADVVRARPNLSLCRRVGGSCARTVGFACVSLFL